MKINKSELQEALAKVKPGLASKDLIEQATSFAFMDGRVVTYNDEISISHPVQDLDISGAVKAEALYSFLGKLKKDEIFINKDDNQVIIQAGKAKAGLILEQEIKLPVQEIGEIKEWKPLPEGIVQGLKFCYPSCSTDMSNPILTCVYVNGDKVQSTDSFQITEYKIKDKIPVPAFLIPSTVVRELIKYDVKEIAEGDGWMHFRTEEGTIFSCRVFGGDFPDVSKFLKVKGMDIRFPKTIIGALEKAQIFSKNQLNVDYLEIVHVEITEGNITISTKGEFGWFEEKARIQYSGAPIKFSTGVGFLMNLLKSMDTPECTLGENQIQFKDTQWTHVLAITSE